METPKTKTTRSVRSLAKNTQNAELMFAGLKANISEVEKRGIDATFISTIENEVNGLKAKTEELNTLVDKIPKLHSEAEKVVKLALPQSQWKKFGMDDKR